MKPIVPEPSRAKSIEGSAQPLLAWYVEDASAEWGEIVYAATRNQARLKGAGIGEAEYVDMRARRNPSYDEFAPNGPSRERLFNDGWWFECAGCGRHAMAGDGESDFIDGEAWCHECAVERAPPAESPPLGAEGTDAALSATDDLNSLTKQLPIGEHQAGGRET